MTEKHEKLLADLEFRLKQLIYLCDTLKTENKNLRNEIESKNKQIEKTNLEMEELRIKYNNLEFANTLIGSDGESIEIAKKRLSKLVQEVDKCITLLKVQ